MACFCLGRASFEAALRKGDVAAALAILQDDPLTTSRTHFRNGNTIWHIAAGCGHLPLLQALAARITAVWPTQAPDPHPDNHQHPQPHHPNAPFQRRSHPFQRISDGLRGIGPATSHLTLAALVNTPNQLGQTALMTACKEGHPACVQFLLSMGANAWYRDRANCTALHYATLQDQGACIEALLQHSASARPPAGTRQSLVRLVDLPNFAGYTPAHFAAVANKPRALAALLAGGANIAARCWSEGIDWISGPAGSTPLHLAARRGDVELCKMVMSHYLEVLRDSGTPDPRLHADVRGCRPYQRAAERGCRELAEMLMPSTPLTYIFGTDVVRLYKVPKLKALASAALQASLLAQINELEAAATERRRLATQAAVAAARAAAAAAGGGAGGTSTGGGAAAEGGGAADAAASASRTSSLINGAIQFVRRQSLRPLNSLRRQLRRSGRWLGLESSSQELRGLSRNSSSVLGGSEEPLGGGPSVYGGGYGGVRTISGVSGVVPATTRQSGVPPPPSALGSMTRASAASAAAVVVGAVAEYGGLAAADTAAAANGLAPLLSVGSERSAPLGPTEASAAPTAAADGAFQGPAAGSSAAAVLPPPPPFAAAGRMTSLPGGISPVWGASLDSDNVPFLPSALSPVHLCSGLKTGAAAAAVADLPCSPPPSCVLPSANDAPTAPSTCRGDLEDPSVGTWAVRQPAAAAAAPCVAGGSPVGCVPGRMAYCPVSLPVQSAPPSPLPSLPSLTSAAHPAASPFALPALQAQPLGRAASGAPGGGSPGHSTDCNIIAGDGGGAAAAAAPPTALGYGLLHPGGRSPPRHMPLPIPATSLGLRTVREDIYADGGGDGGDGSSGGDGAPGMEKVSKRACKYTMSQQPDFDVCGGGVTAAAAVIATVAAQGASGEIAPGQSARAAAAAGGGGGGGDLAGGSPPLSAFQLPGVLGRDTGSTGSRPASGRPQASPCRGAAAAADAGGGGGAAAAANIGSDTSEDYCGVCFERPAFLHIRPCQHTLCAECSREVTRMVETQPALCPFCRGIVRGFGC